uniref:cystathionine gamma-lyase n=1 Tax=Acrobeloides nanus TaxID=290746 RepID=A0A914D890_9BILA
MAAVSAMINILKVGDHIICANDIYGGTQRILQRVSIPLHGLEVSSVDFANQDEIKQALRHNTK